jgi:hypothetical protein
MKCGTLQNQAFCRERYAEFPIQRPFFDNMKAISKIIVFKIRAMSTCLGASFTN